MTSSTDPIELAMAENTGSREPRPRILVVGDWVIDEHWVTSVHRSTTRSRAGKNHSRVLHKPSGWTLSSAGAAKTTEVFYRSIVATEGQIVPEDDSTRAFEVIGAGIWHTSDTGALRALVSEQPTEFHHFNFETLHSSTSGPTLINIAPTESITTRVIRVWQQEGSAYEIENRIDWESEQAPRVSEVTFGVQELGEFQALVLKDIAKGVVTKGMVEKLQSARANRWFISSKLWQPDWYSSLSTEGFKNKVRLVIVPQVAATHALREGISRWFTDSNLISPEAVSALRHLRDLFPQAIICVLPKALSLISLITVGTEDYLFTFRHQPSGQYQTDMPMASVFFPAMVAALLTGWPKTLPHVQTRLTQVLQFVDNWMYHQFQRITAPVEWSAKLEPRLVITNAGLVADTSEFDHKLLVRVIKSPWSVTKLEWDQAHHGCGIVGGRIETRRAAIEVDGYVCLVKQKREVLRRLLSEIRSFDPRSGASKSFMLRASPGSGKSYLVKRLAEMERLELLAFNITSLNIRQDLLDCFDTIVTSQAAQRDRRFFIFFDEIDANLDGQPVYDAFLRPLEEGLYIRAGKAFHVGPCVWMFCGTRSPEESGDDEPRSAEKVKKGSDFLSRLTLPLQVFDYDLTTEHGTEELARLENVYAGVSVLKRVFPDVAYISRSVLEVFRLLPPKTGVRQIDRFVQRFSQIQYGKVSAQSLRGIPWQGNFRISPSSCEEWLENLAEHDADFIAIG